jgi:hypothetical protein
VGRDRQGVVGEGGGGVNRRLKDHEHCTPSKKCWQDRAPCPAGGKSPTSSGKKYEYPKAQARRTGGKVSWLYYKTLRTALKASKIARDDADRQAEMGYDFGFCTPGHVELVEKGEHAGLYEVTIP